MWAPGPIGNVRRHVLVHLYPRRCTWIRHHARPPAIPLFAANDLFTLGLILFDPLSLSFHRC
eukprot:5340410-Heterocapsa_arctica.AAC.1